jgi:hypothetical protein
MRKLRVQRKVGKTVSANFDNLQKTGHLAYKMK